MSQARWIERSIYPWAVVLQTDPDPGPRAADRLLVRVRLRQPGAGVRADRALPDHHQHALRPESRPTSPPRPVHPAPRRPADPAGANCSCPAALPAIFAGLRISAGLSVIGAIVGDFFFKQGEPGIGALIEVYRQRLQSEQLFGAVILSSLLGARLLGLRLPGPAGGRVVARDPERPGPRVGRPPAGRAPRAGDTSPRPTGR